MQLSWRSVTAEACGPALLSSARIGLALTMAAILGTPSAVSAAPAFVRTGSLHEGRYSHAAVLLNGGQVLVLGGWTNSAGYSFALSSAELYDPATGTFSLTGSMAQARIAPAAVVLRSGKVLVAGGYGPSAFGGYVPLSSAELYDPASGTFFPAGNMLSARQGLTATLLADGSHVLLAGGSDASVGTVDTAEVYDEATDSFTATVGNMTQPRHGHATALLPTGKVLVAGGCNYFSCPSSSAELYDPDTQTFAVTGSMNAGRYNATATPLANGVLLAGGMDASGEVYDPSAGTFSSTQPMTQVRSEFAAAQLPSGQVLLAGGTGPLSSAERFDPVTGFTATASMHDARQAFTATRLANDTVLVAGGSGTAYPYTLTAAELYHEAGVVDTEPPAVSAHDDITVVSPDSSGVQVTFAVTAVDDVDASPVVTCQPPSGTIFGVGTTQVACTATDSSENTSDPETFNVTVLPPLEISMTFAKAGSVDTRTGVATIGGTVTCNRPVKVEVFAGQLTQTVANRAVVAAPFYVGGIGCTGVGATPWTAVALPTSGRFNAGKAAVSAVVQGCEFIPPFTFSCDSYNAASTIQLTGKK
jgi:hypothetical protein